jgi:xylulokinase
MNSSTINENTENLFQIPESKAYERYTASQIMKIFQKTPEIYQQTERIQLISNFLASILLGDYAPIDLSDGSRMNLFDIHQHKWSKESLNIYEKDLEKKLSDKFVYSRTSLGKISKYFIERYGFDNHCQIVSFTGDNLSSYYALASDPKTVVVSLGINDTVMASISASSIPQEAFDGHLFINPFIVNHENDLLMLLLCFKNGTLVRERR